MIEKNWWPDFWSWELGTSHCCSFKMSTAKVSHSNRPFAAKGHMTHENQKQKQKEQKKMSRKNK